MSASECFIVVRHPPTWIMVPDPVASIQPRLR
jgi:hypothetical protein